MPGVCCPRQEHAEPMPDVPLSPSNRERVPRDALSLRMDAGAVPVPEAKTPQENGCAGGIGVAHSTSSRRVSV
jgi:hypothetical protein